MGYTKVKSYTDVDLINRMMALPSFKYVPKGDHIISVRSKEDTPGVYDDKDYHFVNQTCVAVMPCTTNTGTYGLRNFRRWNKRGAAVVKADEIYYNAFMKSDGKRVRHHNNKQQCLRQIGFMKYYRDNNMDDKVDETGKIYEANYSTNIHCNSYKYKTGIRSWFIRGWSTGCNVINNLTKYWEMINRIPYDTPVTYTLLKEF